MAAVNSVARAYVETCKCHCLSMVLEQCSKLQEFKLSYTLRELATCADIYMGQGSHTEVNDNYTNFATL